MSSSETFIRMLPDRAHSDICQCDVCMKSKISETTVAEHESGLKSTMVDRRNSTAPAHSLMKSVEAHAILKADSDVNMLKVMGLSKEVLPSGYDIEPTEPKELRITARWKDRSKEVGVSGRKASVFGAPGVLLIPPDVNIVNIPTMNALAVPTAFLEKYGAELIPLDKPFHLDAVPDKTLENLYLVEYRFDKDYMEQFVMQLTGGGGVFVETHPFPQTFTPLAQTCSGGLILGVKKNDDQFDFASFKIPYGFTLKIAPNVIHGDSFFIGPYAIALTETDLADAVLFKQDVENRDMQTIVHIPVMPTTLPLLAEHRLASAINRSMMIEKIRHEGPEGKDYDFFLNLPMQVLTAVHDMSMSAEKAFEARGGTREMLVEQESESDEDTAEGASIEGLIRAPDKQLSFFGASTKDNGSQSTIENTSKQEHESKPAKKI